MFDLTNQLAHECTRPPHRPGPRQSILEFMQENFGKAGAYYYWISRSVDHREVRANRIRKSIGTENTFSGDLTDSEAMLSELQPLIDKVWPHCDEKGSRGRTVTLKVKFSDFEILTPSRSHSSPVANRDDLAHQITRFLKENMPLPKPVRLLGVSWSSLQGNDNEGPQLDFGI
jgi:DNA polymerase-4